MRPVETGLCHEPSNCRSYFFRTSIASNANTNTASDNSRRVIRLIRAKRDAEQGYATGKSFADSSETALRYHSCDMRQDRRMGNETLCPHIWRGLEVGGVERWAKCDEYAYLLERVHRQQDASHQWCLALVERAQRH